MKATTNEIPLEKSTNWTKYFTWILFAISFFVYANSLNNSYNMDDQLVTKNHRYTSQGISAIKDIFTSPYYSDDMGYNYGYRPIVHLSFALEHSIFGESPKIGHFINVLFFAFCTIAFYKLLVLLFNKENTIYCFIASLVFAIHPIHTEVVNSLKNRDELLAFLFVVLSFIQLFKFVTENSIKHLVFGFLYFIIAILSKKSCYPILLILPSFIYLTQHISYKKSLIAINLYAIPAAIVASELLPSRFIVLLLLPSILLGCIILLKKHSDKLSGFKYIILLLIIVATSLYLNSVYISLLSLPLLLQIHRYNPNCFYLIGITIFLILGFKFNMSILLVASILISIHYGIYEFKQNKKLSIFAFIVAIIVSLYLTIFHEQIFIFLLALNFLATLLIANKYKIIPWIYFFFLIIATYFYKQEVFSNLSYIISTQLLICLSITSGFAKKMMAPLMISLALIFACIKQFKHDQKNSITNQQTEQFDNSKQLKITQNDGSNILREGRDLEYMENPLVANHSKSEKIATGFYTLGTYFNLMIFPKDLSFYYGYATIEIQQLTSFPVILSIVIHCLIGFLIVFYYRKNWMITLGFAWYLACILLFSNWVELVAGVVGERLAFLASAGLILGLVGLIQEFKLLEKWKTATLVLITTVAIIGFGRTWVRNTDWKDQYTLMKNDIKHLDNSAQANNLYASTLMVVATQNNTLTTEQQKIFIKAGVKHYKKATEIYPAFFNAQFDLGRAAMYINDTLTAMQAFKACVKIDSTYQPAIEHYNFLKENYKGN